MRTLGEKIPVSIGTAISLETISANKTITEQYSLCINIRTLFRNFYQADPLSTSKAVVLAEEFIAELMYIEAHIKSLYKLQKGNPIYFPTYKSVKKYLPAASLKVIKTEKQHAYELLEALVLGKVIDELGFKQYTSVDCIVPGSVTPSLILTHLPIDLLSFNKFIKLSLLESHTGNIRERKEWIKKITANPKFQTLPFNRFTYQVLGDRSKIHESAGKDILTAVCSIAKSGKWTQLTTMEKIIYDINGLKNMDELKQQLLKFTK